MNYRYFLLLILLVSLSPNANETKCTIKPPGAQPAQGKEFKPLFAGVDSISLSICQSLVEGEPIDLETSNWFAEWEDTLRIELNELDGLSFDKEKVVAESYNSLVALSLPKTIRSTQNKKTSLYDLHLGNEKLASFSNSECSKASSRKNCKLLFRDLDQAIKAPFSASLYYEGSISKERIAFKNKAWDNYFFASRSQTFVDIALNTWLYRNEIKKDKLVMPPEVQFFVAHPSLILHYAHGAPDGGQLKEGLAIEWLGFNFWNWDVPFGASVITTYSDLTDVKDSGYGVMFHFANKYSLGMTRNGDENTLVFTIDLLKMFESKESNYKAYLEEAKEHF
tara:strand:+ start:2502 stop:3512 length:1011 start_codon:yes stop_codon:yes gene_type:complete